ncbi:phasin family protein [Teredinibacter turnerae]|uniref:phasin family protein n=1 Tax=Teredinibacter turnerae TaxID=2426 RepID=UPI0004007689|nr:phasin family protein [Teredinibacter turnerae]
MYEKIYEQADSFFKPITDILTISLETMDTFREKQTAFVSDVVADGIEYAKGVGDHGGNMETFYSAQKSYWENVQTKMSCNAKESMALLSETQEKITEVIQDSSPWFEDKPVKKAAKSVAPAKASKPATKKKATAKAAPKAASAVKADPVKAESGKPKTESAPKPAAPEKSAGKPNEVVSG